MHCDRDAKTSCNVIEAPLHLAMAQIRIWTDLRLVPLDALHAGCNVYIVLSARFCFGRNLYEPLVTQLEPKMSEKADIDTPQSLPKHEQDLVRIPRKPSKLQSCSSFIYKLAIFGLALYGFDCLSHETFNRIKEIANPTVCNCGSSISEAKSKNCKFDSLTTSWLPPACRDDELTAEFERCGPLEGGSWPYYKDLRKTHLFSVEDLANMADSASGDRTYYTTTEWFIARCLFYWRKMERAERLGTTIERSFLDTSIDGHHISSWHHCTNVYLEGTPRDQISTAGLVGFGDPIGSG